MARLLRSASGRLLRNANGRLLRAAEGCCVYRLRECAENGELVDLYVSAADWSPGDYVSHEGEVYRIPPGAVAVLRCPQMTVIDPEEATEEDCQGDERECGEECDFPDKTTSGHYYAEIREVLQEGQQVPPCVDMSADPPFSLSWIRFDWEDLPWDPGGLPAWPGFTPDPLITPVGGAFVGEGTYTDSNSVSFPVYVAYFPALIPGDDGPVCVMALYIVGKEDPDPYSNPAGVLHLARTFEPCGNIGLISPFDLDQCLETDVGDGLWLYQRDRNEIEITIDP